MLHKQLLSLEKLGVESSALIKKDGVLHVLGSAQGRHVITNNQTLKDKFFYGDTVELQGQ